MDIIEMTIIANIADEEIRDNVLEAYRKRIPIQGSIIRGIAQEYCPSCGYGNQKGKYCMDCGQALIK